MSTAWIWAAAAALKGAIKAKEQLDWEKKHPGQPYLTPKQQKEKFWRDQAISFSEQIRKNNCQKETQGSSAPSPCSRRTIVLDDGSSRHFVNTNNATINGWMNEEEGS